MNKMLRICMIGAGRVGKLHSGTLSRFIPEARVTAIVDPAAQVLNETADQFEIPERFESLEDALDGSDFDAVVITTPTFTHKKLAVLAAKAGKHIFLEKPMALDLEECDAISQSARENQVLVQLGFMRRFDPEFAAAKARIDAGEIGEPMMIKSLTNGPGLPPAWANDLETSNGMLAEVNSHDWDCTRWLMNADPYRVYVETANFKGKDRGVTTEHFYDNVIVNIKFDSGGLGCISGICPCDYGYDARVEITGTKGVMQIGEMKGQAVIVCTNRDEGLITPIYRTWPQRFAWAYIHEMEHFVNCVIKGEEPKVTTLDGRWAVAGVLAGTRSFLEERPVLLNEVLGANHDG